MESTFELLKWRLLLMQLDSIQSCELHALVIREADAAAALARGTGFPWLCFPCLFEERVDAALAQQAREAILYWQQFRAPLLCPTPTRTATLTGPRAVPARSTHATPTTPG